MKKISFLIFLSAFLILRPYQLQSNGLCYQGDDQSYFAHASSIAFFQFPRYEKEYFSMGDARPEHPIGAGLMAAPFVFAFSLIDRALGSSIALARTPDNIYSSWSLFGFVFAAVFYFWWACFFLYKGLRVHFRKDIAFWAVTLMIFTQYTALYAFRRPIFSHIFELFLQSVMVYLLLKKTGSDEANHPGYREAIIPGLVCGLMALVRYNNLPYALLWPLVLWGRPLSLKSLKSYRGKITASYILIGLVILMFKILPESLTYWGGLETAKTHMFSAHPPAFYWKRLWHIFFGLDWGLVFTAPFLLLGAFHLFFIKDEKIRRATAVLLLPAAINLIVVIQWATQAGYYGYRYFFFSLAPLILYPLADALQQILASKRKTAIVLLAFLALFPVMSLICFEGNSTTLTQHSIEQPFGRQGWGNNTYQREVWKTIIGEPKEFAVIVAKGGPLYLAYAIANAAGQSSRLPGIVLEKYPGFSLTIFIRVMILYTLPFILNFLFCRKEQSRDDPIPASREKQTLTG